MPEGHVIHRIAREHHERFSGKRLQVSSPQGRFADEAQLLDGKVLRRAEAHGKHLFYYWQGRQIVHVHLGLYGRFRNHSSPPPPPEGEVRLRAVGRQFAFDLNGPNRCELVDFEAMKTILQRLGPDPLRARTDPTPAWQRIRRSRAPIGTLLLDQSVIAGAGNIYRADVLFETAIHPMRAGSSLSRDDFDRIWKTLTRFMQWGLKYKRIVNAEPARVGKPRSRMSREESLLVYKKQQCSRCSGPIKTWELAGRAIFACPACQPL